MKRLIICLVAFYLVGCNSDSGSKAPPETCINTYTLEYCFSGNFKISYYQEFLLLKEKYEPIGLSGLMFSGNPSEIRKHYIDESGKYENKGHVKYKNAELFKYKIKEGQDIPILHEAVLYSADGKYYIRLQSSHEKRFKTLLSELAKPHENI